MLLSWHTACSLQGRFDTQTQGGTDHEITNHYNGSSFGIGGSIVIRRSICPRRWRRRWRRLQRWRWSGGGRGSGNGSGIQQQSHVQTQTQTQTQTRTRAQNQVNSEAMSANRPVDSQRRDGTFLTTGTTANGSTTRPGNGQGLQDGSHLTTTTTAEPTEAP